MKNERLSKLQKWILINCYRVTILRDRSNLKLKSIKHNTHVNHDYDFYKEDIYMDFYNLEIDPNKMCNESVAHFVSNEKSGVAWVSVHRVLKLLKDKGLIDYFKPLGDAYSTHITLTDEGINVAESLIANDKK